MLVSLTYVSVANLVKRKMLATANFKTSNGIDKREEKLSSRASEGTAPRGRAPAWWRKRDPIPSPSPRPAGGPVSAPPRPTSTSATATRSCAASSSRPCTGWAKPCRRPPTPIRPAIRKRGRPREGLYRLRESEPGVFALMFGLTGSHADDAALAEEGQGKFEIVCRVVAEHLRLPPDHPGGGGKRAYALWCAVHGHAFLVLDGKADKTKISVDEDAYLRLAGRCLPAPGRRPRLIRWGRGWSVFPCSGDLYGASRDRTHDRWRALRDRQPRRD
jgi:hypothetical protein